jgi:hypothetical protein
MNEVELDVCNVRGNKCLKVIWMQVPIGLIKQDENGSWRNTKELKGEFWSMNEHTDKETAVNELIQERKELDEFRLRMITGK